MLVLWRLCQERRNMNAARVHASAPPRTLATPPSPCRCFTRLESPPVRVCGSDTPFPLVFEPLYLPGVARVAAAVRQAVDFA